MKVAEETPLVERPGPGAPPTAFRIWKHGANPNSSAPANFTPRSAGLLLQDQERRGARYPINVDHLPVLSSDPHAHVAVGWFTLEVRGDGLWAVQVTWCDSVVSDAVARGALKYVSPEWIVDQETGEVTKFLALALVTCPATLQPTDLCAASCSSVSTHTAILGLQAEAARLVASGLSAADVSTRMHVAATKAFNGKAMPDGATLAERKAIFALRNPSLATMPGSIAEVTFNPRVLEMRDNVLRLGTTSVTVKP